MPNLSILKKNKYSDVNREIIEQYIATDESGITLTEKQEELLIRWRYADELIRQQRYIKEDVSKFIMKKFNVSRDTAFRDIVSAEAVFSSSTPLNKKYHIGLRIEFLEKQIRAAATANDFKAVAMLEKVLANYYDIYPDTVLPSSPRTVVFNLIQNNTTETVIPIPQAVRMANEIIEDLPHYE